jgi:hypothetical protein
MSAVTELTPVVVRSGDGKVFQFPGDSEAQQFESSAKAAGGKTLRLVSAPLPTARPLYDLEAHLAALMETEESVPDKLEQEYALELHATLLAVVEKRDRVGQFLAHLESKIAFAKAERERLLAREMLYQRALDRMTGYVTRVIESLGLDDKGKRKKLEGKTITLSLQGCDKRAEVTDEPAVPKKYKRIIVALPLDTWDLACDSLDLDLREQVLCEVKSPQVEVARVW